MSPLSEWPGAIDPPPHCGGRQDKTVGTSISAAPPLLEVRHLSVVFHLKGREVPILHDVSFQLPASRTLGIAGESGSGKSVTALSILRLIPSPPLGKMTGEIRYARRDLLDLPVSHLRSIRGREIAIVFQEPMTALNPVVTIGDQIVEAIRTHEKASRKEAGDRAVELLREVGIPAPVRRMRAYPHELSGGMRQRAMIAMAVSCNPRVLIADEPTTALDVTVQAQVLELFRKLREERKMSMIFITHNLGVLAEIADELLVMQGGSVREHGPVEAVFHSPSHPYTRELLSLLPGRNRHGPR